MRNIGIQKIKEIADDTNKLNDELLTVNDKLEKMKQKKNIKKEKLQNLENIIKEKEQDITSKENEIKNIVAKYTNIKKNLIIEREQQMWKKEMEDILKRKNIKYKTTWNKLKLKEFIQQNHPDIFSELIGVVSEWFKNEESKQEAGEGKKNNNTGLWLAEIDDIMQPFKYYIQTIL